MKGFLIFALLILLISPVFAETKGNPDILKRNIIDDCEGIDEFGNCILNEETESVPDRITGTITKVGNAAAVNLGIPNSTEIVIIIIVAIIVIASIIFVLKVASG